MAKLFHSFGAAAKKAQSPSVVWVTPLGASCRRSLLFDLKFYSAPSLILISSQRNVILVINKFTKSYTAKDNHLQSLHWKPYHGWQLICMQANYSWRLKGHFAFKSNLNLFYGKQQWTIHMGHFVVQILQFSSIWTS